MTSDTPRRVVAIASGHSFGDRILGRFGDAGIRLEALMVTVQQSTPRDLPGGGLRERAGRARGRARAWWRAWRRFRHVANRISAFDSLADGRLREALVRARPDVLVLAGTGIVPAEVLAIPSLATLNAHPGLLPWVRGVCPLEHAVLRGVPLGVTVHAVDAGIDTGPIVRRVLLPIAEDEHDRISLSRRLEDRAIDALTEVVSGLALRSGPFEVFPQSSRHPYGRWVSQNERKEASQLLATGRAARLYETWRAAAGSDILPDDDTKLPGPSG